MQLFVLWEIQFLHILFSLGEYRVGIVLSGIILQEHLVAIRKAVFHRIRLFSKFCIWQCIIEDVIIIATRLVLPKQYLGKLTAAFYQLCRQSIYA